MASKGRTDPIRDAAVERFAARSHEAWRRTLLKTNPEQKGKPRMRMRGGVMVDVNQPWSKLHPKAKSDNERAARDAYEAVRRFPRDREAAAAYVHERWIARNKRDPSQPKELFKPYARLPDLEKDKDRAHVDNMKRALAAVTRRAKPVRKSVSKKSKAKTKKSVARKRAAQVTVKLDAGAWRLVRSAARDLTKDVARPIAPEALLEAWIRSMAALNKGARAEARQKKS